jgi:hypothetical protein
MPAEHGGRGDQSMRARHPGQQPDQDGEHGAVGPVQSRLRVLSAQDGVLVPQDEDLQILGRVGGREQRQPPEHTAEHEV